MADQIDIEITTNDLVAASRVMDAASGGALGILLGLLVGLSGSPIVSSVATGLVALLAGLFGLSEKLSPNLASSTARRIVAFGLAAVIAAPAAIYVRTHDFLGPSVGMQRAALAEIGIKDDKEQNEMLRFLRFGILPSGVSTVPKDSPAGAVLSSHQGILFAQPASFCNLLLQLSNGSPDDVLALFEQQSKELKDVATVIRGLPSEQRQPALNAGRIYLCGVK